MEQAISFVTTPQGRVAFATFGSGPPLLCDTPWVSHLTYMWQGDAYRNFFEQLAALTVIRYDRPGTGLSDRNRTDFTWEPDIQAVEAVVDRLGLKRLSLLGMGLGGAIAALYAARHPDRVERLIFYGTAARGPALATGDVQRSLVALPRAHWGLGSQTLADLFVAGCDTATQEWFTRCQQVAVDAETAARLLELIYVTDVSRELAGIQAPS
jgi:pimeloyl-ACP methyl ester carboxylesterase